VSRQHPKYEAKRKRNAKKRTACKEFVIRTVQHMDIIKELRIALMDKDRDSGRLVKEIEELKANNKKLKMDSEAVKEASKEELKKAKKEFEAQREILVQSAEGREALLRDEMKQLLLDHQASIKSKDDIISGLSEEVKTIQGQNAKQLERINRLNERVTSYEKIEFAKNVSNLQKAKTPDNTGYESRLWSYRRQRDAGHNAAVSEAR
jgi:hypothetical protein